jgi:NAD(P)H dehydrogenase (quinone)
MITVTAATGHYGRLVIEELLKRGVPAADIVAAVRTPQKAADLAERGVQVREADYDRPETLVPAFSGADKLLLIPSTVYRQRYPQMQRAVTAAARPRWACSPTPASSTATPAPCGWARSTSRPRP